MCLFAHQRLRDDRPVNDRLEVREVSTFLECVQRSGAIAVLSRSSVISVTALFECLFK